MSTYRMTWPVNDPRVPLDVLLGQASYDLRGALAVAHMQPAGPPTWRIEQRNGLRLTVELPVAGEGARLGPRDLQPCGTHAAFARHRRNGEPVDEACRVAERAYQASRKRASRAAEALGEAS